MADCSRDRGLGNIQAFGSKGDAAGLGGGYEVFNLAQGESHRLTIFQKLKSLVMG
jgi:hypothetical protein